MKQPKSLIFLIIALFFLACSSKKQELHQLVDPFVGTGGHGHTYPGVSMPFGMVQLSPDTRLEGWDGCSGYHNSDSIIYGFSHTHLSGTGVSDYGDILLMPGQGQVFFDNGYKSASENSYRSRFLKENEKAHAGYYEVLLEKNKIKARLTSTERVGFHEYTFSKGDSCHLILDLFHRDELILADLEYISKTEIAGQRNSRSWAQNQKVIFYLQFSQPYTDYEHNDLGGVIAFNFKELSNQKLKVKVALSAVSVEGAKKNMEAELNHWDFEKAKKQAEQTWDKALSKIELVDADENQKGLFYTSLYHAMLAPNIYSDVDGKYRGMDDEVHSSDHAIYTVFSLWDTFRASHPLFTIIEPKRNLDFVKTLLKQYADGGELPIWELAANYTGCMIGYHAIPVIVDAFIKGINEFDQELALEAMLKSARNEKLGLDAYKRKGFIAMDDEAESVSKTLEYAYDDWCIANYAEALGNNTVYEEMIHRAQFYKNLYNPELGFMQSKLRGSWTSGFDPAEVNFNFTEANSWQYSLFAPQDIAGLIELYGGEQKFEEQLDNLFNTEMELTGRHQVDITGLIGQYAHGNEPSHHMAYLYNFIGKAYKTQERVDQILKEQYHLAPDGLSGNEDCGQMSAWYVLSSLGFYAVSPGTDYYAIGTPLHKKAIIHLENGNHFRLIAENRTEENKYIQSATLNGQPLDRAFLKHAEIMGGGELRFQMGSNPNPDWGNEERIITSIPETDQLAINPFVKTDGFIFSDSIKIEMGSPQKEAVIYYRLNGENTFQEYKKPFYLKENSRLELYADYKGKQSFKIEAGPYSKIKAGRNIKLFSEYSNQYRAGGDQALLDYMEGGKDFRTGFWQGYYDTDFEAIVDLGQVEELNEISLGALQDIKSWIWLSPEVSFYASRNGEEYELLAKVKHEVSDSLYGSIKHQFKYQLKRTRSARYVKIQATTYGNCPNWHLGAGHPTWLFFDEIKMD